MNKRSVSTILQVEKNLKFKEKISRIFWCLSTLREIIFSQIKKYLLKNIIKTTVK